MSLSKHLRTVVFSVVFGSLALFSCAEKNPTNTVSDGLSNGVGQALVQLPDLSSSAMKKLAVGIEPNALTLQIVASDMDTIKYSWPVTILKGQLVQIDGIPAGYNRLFEGFLTNKTGVLTHSGKVAVRIIAGQNVPVHLNLSGVGGADVCIDVEGYASSCYQEDTTLIYSCLKGAAPEPIDGSLKMINYGMTAYGDLKITNTQKSSSTYYSIYKTIQIVDSANYKYYRLLAVDVGTKISHYLSIVYYKNSNAINGYISSDSTQSGPILVKFYSVDCKDTTDTTIVDTTYTKVPFNGSGVYPDTSKFQATMVLKTFNDTNAIGDFYFYNWSRIKANPVHVSGTLQSYGTSGILTLNSSDLGGFYYEIVLKTSAGYYSGMISQVSKGAKVQIGNITVAK